MAGPPYTGHCGCGAVRFTVTGAPLSVGYCHCTRCQRRTGTAASANARLPSRDALRIEQGEDLLGSWEADGGFAKLFCSRCGSALFSHSPDHAHWAVRLGALDPGHDVRPTFRRRVETACAWEPLPDDGLPRSDGRAPENA